MIFDLPNNDLPLPLPITVDLMKLGSSVEAKGGGHRLAKSLRTAWRAQSCLSDLRHAQGICDAIDTVSHLVDTLDTGTYFHVRSGMLATAVVLYARATTSSSAKKSERGAVQLDSARLTPEQLEDHEALVRVRNGAIGHVEGGVKIVGDFWHRDFLFAKRSGLSNWDVSSASLCIGFHDQTFEILKRQLPIASAQIEIKSRERIEGAMQVIRDLKLNDADLLKHQVDPVKWFGSVHAALLALGVNSGEDRSGWTPLL